MMNKIPAIVSQLETNKVDTGPNSNKVKDGAKPDFSNTIREFLSSVNNSQKNAAEKVTEVIDGTSENIAEAMTAVEESRLNFQLLLEVRNKLLEAFREIQRMQI